MFVLSPLQLIVFLTVNNICYIMELTLNNGKTAALQIVFHILFQNRSKILDSPLPSGRVAIKR